MSSPILKWVTGLLRGKHHPPFNEKGQSLVELSISLLILLLILNAIVDLGSLLYSYISLQDTTQEGIVYGSYDPMKTTDIKNRIRSSADFPLIASTIQNSDINIYCCAKTTVGNCTVLCASNSINACPGQKFTVEVKYNYRLTLPFLTTFLGTNIFPMRVRTTSSIIESPTTIQALKDLGQSCP